MSLRTVLPAHVHQASSSAHYPDDAFLRALSVIESRIVASQKTLSQIHLMKMHAAVTWETAARRTTFGATMASRAGG